MTHRVWRRDAGLALAELGVPAVVPGDGRVVVRVEGAALEPWAATAPGRVPGLAAVGNVVTTGNAAAEWLGARVVVPTLAPCGECDCCRRGGAALCPDGASHGIDGPGTLATTVTAAARWLVRLEPSDSRPATRAGMAGGAGMGRVTMDVPGPAAAALGGELALAYALYARAGVGPRDPVIVWGRGAVARATAAILAAKGAPAHVATDDAALAAALGAAAGPATAAAAIAALTSHDARRPRKVIVTAPELLLPALAAAGPRATVVVLTAPGTSYAPAADLGAALAAEITMTGVAGCHPDLVPELVALVVRGDLALDDLVEVVALDDLPARLVARAAARPPTTLVVALPAV